MSLLVWLPLTNDLTNQGLSSATFSYVNNNGKLSINASGKLGKCYERTASGYADLFRSSTTFNLSGDLSMCCWAYVSATVGDTANGLITNHNHADNTSVGITVKQVSTTDYRICCSTGTGSSRTFYTYYGTTNIKDAWHHLALTYNKATQVLQLWVDGVVEYTLNNYANASGNNTFDLFNWSTGYGSYSQYRPVCKLNDVRLYDHCLSVKEVKELAKGLVCHYKLSSGGQENLLRMSAMGTDAQVGFVANSSTDWTKYFRYYNGSAANHTFADGVDTVLLSSASNLGVCFQRKATDISLDSNSYYTLSCEAKCTKASAHLDIGLSYYNNSNAWVWRGGSNPKNFNAVNVWQKFTHTFKPDADTQYIDYCFTVVGVTNGTDTFSIRHCKLEKGSVATPWIPNSADTEYSIMGYNDTTVYDCSGYGYHGVINTSQAVNANTARYSTSTTFNGTDNCITIPFNTMCPTNIFTMNIWFYKDALGSKNYETLVGGPSGFEMDTRAGTATTLSLYMASTRGSTLYSPLEFNMWNMITMVRDGTNEYYYVNGDLKKTITAKSMPTGTYFIGAWNTKTSQNYYGLMSDFRLYSTCLSADDILELYHTGASIDKSGNMYAYELREV